ncbi:uncharacterized protein LOC134216589 isoform X2 [Armigeres subalbatus]|uniref:uncharacterized protein LOC134216589 isoform X2 n=1 Tax=Armigeres subalbatus TaxID=124917 RepID=UPI002ED40CEC
MKPIKQGIVLLRVRYVIEDIDSCNMVQTSIYEVQLQSTSETFEISSESNITDATNCRNKRKLLEAIQLGGLIRVQNVVKIEGDQIQLENISVEQFRLDMEKLVPEDFRIVDSKFSYQFATDGEVTSDAELIEMRVRMVNTGNEYVVNTIGAMEVYGAMAPRARPYPPKVLLSLLGGGSYKKMKRITKT